MQKVAPKWLKSTSELFHEAEASASIKRESLGDSFGQTLIDVAPLNLRDKTTKQVAIVGLPKTTPTIAKTQFKLDSVVWMNLNLGGRKDFETFRPVSKKLLLES